MTDLKYGFRLFAWTMLAIGFGAGDFKTASTAYAGNPLVKDIGMSDPHMRVFNGKVYLYCGHDDTPNDKTWVMKEWRIFTSTDLIDWKQVGTVSPTENYMADDSTSCWACDAASRNGKYLFYFSDHKDGVGVMTSDRPEGPFVDPLGEPLVQPLHDPTAFIDDDDDKTPYLLYGDKTLSYKIVKLNDDMTSLAEKPQNVVINGEAWDNAPEWMDKSYLFKRGDTYYLSWGQEYATSKNIYGPYQCAGKVGEGFGLSEYAHGSFFEWKGQFYHCWCYYLKKGFKYRESIMTYCHFDDDGNIVDDIDFLDQHFETGMGQYSADWPEIQTEWFYEKSPSVKKQQSSEGGFELTGLEEGSWIRFANVDFGSGKSEINLHGRGTGSVDVCIGNKPEGGEWPIVATLDFDDNGNDHTISGSIGETLAKHDVYLRFHPKGSNDLTVDWLNFKP